MVVIIAVCGNYEYQDTLACAHSDGETIKNALLDCGVEESNILLLNDFERNDIFNAVEALAENIRSTRCWIVFVAICHGYDQDGNVFLCPKDSRRLEDDYCLDHLIRNMTCESGLACFFLTCRTLKGNIPRSFNTSRLQRRLKLTAEKGGPQQFMVFACSRGDKLPDRNQFASLLAQGLRASTTSDDLHDLASRVHNRWEKIEVLQSKLRNPHPLVSDVFGFHLSEGSADIMGTANAIVVSSASARRPIFPARFASGFRRVFPWLAVRQTDITDAIEMPMLQDEFDNFELMSSCNTPSSVMLGQRCWHRAGLVSQFCCAGRCVLCALNLCTVLLLSAVVGFVIVKWIAPAFNSMQGCLDAPEVLGSIDGGVGCQLPASYGARCYFACGVNTLPLGGPAECLATGKWKLWGGECFRIVASRVPRLLHFVERPRELAALQNATVENRAASVIGPPGSGKTWLAYKYSWRMRSRAHVTWLFDASDTRRLSDSYRRLHRKLGFSSKEEGTRGISLCQLIDEIMDGIEGHAGLDRPGLQLRAVFDGVVAGALDGRCSHVPRCRWCTLWAIFTTRDPTFDFPNANLVDVSQLQRNESIELLRKIVGPSRFHASNAEFHAAAIADTLGNLTLSVACAGYYLRSSHDISFKEFLRQYELEMGRTLEKMRNSACRQHTEIKSLCNMFVIVDMSLKEIEMALQNDARPRRVLEILAHLDTSERLPCQFLKDAFHIPQQVSSLDKDGLPYYRRYFPEDHVTKNVSADDIIQSLEERGLLRYYSDETDSCTYVVPRFFLDLLQVEAGGEHASNRVLHYLNSGARLLYDVMLASVTYLREEPLLSTHAQALVYRANRSSHYSLSLGCLAELLSDYNVGVVGDVTLGISFARYNLLTALPRTYHLLTVDSYTAEGPQLYLREANANITLAYALSLAGQQLEARQFLEATATRMGHGTLSGSPIDLLNAATAYNHLFILDLAKNDLRRASNALTQCWHIDKWLSDGAMSVGNVLTLLARDGLTGIGLDAQVSSVARQALIMDRGHLGDLRFLEGNFSAAYKIHMEAFQSVAAESSGHQSPEIFRGLVAKRQSKASVLNSKPWFPGYMANLIAPIILASDLMALGCSCMALDQIQSSNVVVHSEKTAGLQRAALFTLLWALRLYAGTLDEVSDAKLLRHSLNIQHSYLPNSVLNVVETDLALSMHQILWEQLRGSVDLKRLCNTELLAIGHKMQSLLAAGMQLTMAEAGYHYVLSPLGSLAAMCGHAAAWVNTTFQWQDQDAFSNWTESTAIQLLKADIHSIRAQQMLGENCSDASFHAAEAERLAGLIFRHKRLWGLLKLRSHLVNIPRTVLASCAMWAGNATLAMSLFQQGRQRLHKLYNARPYDVCVTDARETVSAKLHWGLAEIGIARRAAELGLVSIARLAWQNAHKQLSQISASLASAGAALALHELQRLL